MDDSRRDNAGKASLTLDEDEVRIVGNALNEICHGVHIDDFEFHARIGADRKEAKTLLDRVLALRDEMQRVDH